MNQQPMSPGCTIVAVIVIALIVVPVAFAQCMAAW